MDLKNKVEFLFDVDGTLTPHRAKIDEEFRLFFLKFINEYHCTLVTGSDYIKTVEQLGKDIIENIDVYNCNGNAKTSKGYTIYERRWDIPQPLLEYLQGVLDISSWKERYENNIEDRGSMINFSIIGRNCLEEARERYYEWDKITREREKICKSINHLFPALEANIGGHISIDIGPKGSTKDQVLKYFKKSIYYFGNAVYPGGNDFTIAQRIESENLGKVYRVTDYTETREILKAIYDSESTGAN